jgi:hypothetical protein
MGWMTEVRFPAGERDFFFSVASRPALGSTQPPLQWILGPVSLVVKQHGHETDHSLPSSAKVMNAGAIPPLHCMHSWHSA